MAIKSLTVKGFRSLADVKLGLGDLTVLIGPNNAGKTNLLDLFKFLSQAAEGQLSEGVQRRGGLGSLLFTDRAGHRAEDICVDLELETVTPEPLTRGLREPSSYGFTLKPALAGFSIAREKLGGTDLRKSVRRIANIGFPVAGPTVSPRQSAQALNDLELAVSQPAHLPMKPARETRPVRWLLSSCRFYGYPLLDTRPQALTRLPQVVRRDAELAPDGSNLASVLYTLQSTEERSVAYNEICATLSAAFPEFRELRFPPEGGDGRILLRWVEKGQKYGRSSFDLSDGTLSFLYLATLLLGPKPSLLICIDEPEVGLHPHAIRLVAEMLQAAAERTQLVVATHSPILVDAVKPEQVVIVEKGEDGATQFRRLDAEELKEWLKEFSLGELWLTGHLGERA